MDEGNRNGKCFIGFEKIGISSDQKKTNRLSRRILKKITEKRVRRKMKRKKMKHDEKKNRKYHFKKLAYCWH